MEYTYFANGDPFPDEVEVNFNMFCALVLHQIGGQIHRTYVITIDQSSGGDRLMEFKENITEPCGFSHCVCDSSVFSLCTLLRDCVFSKLTCMTKMYINFRTTY